jgi:phosphatidylglycerol lysyltransferase
LLPGDVTLTYPAFLTVYVLAIVTGIASHVPGGLGVFEGLLLLALPEIPKDGLLAAVLMYRLIYYLLPLLVAAFLAAGHELRAYGGHIARGLELAQDALEGVAPQTLGGAVFVTGTVLLLSGATPPIPARMELLRDWLPLPLLECAHLGSSLVGLGLTLLTGVLNRRSHTAYRLALGLLVIAVPAALFRGLDWEEALLAGLVALALWAARAAFRRRTSLWEQTFSTGWIAIVAVLLGGSLWLGLLAYKQVEFAHELWWQFAFDADAPRFLRATLAMMIMTAGLGLLQLLRPSQPVPTQPDPAELDQVAALVERSPTTNAALALLGDKRILFDLAGTGFLMFQIHGPSWIAMGDPVGPPLVAEDLAWRFHELCDHHGGQAVFYQVDPGHLPLYLELGLTPLKIGEEAVVDLSEFCLELTGLGQGWQNLVKTGMTFEVVAAGALAESRRVEQLLAVSDAWQKHQGTGERGFSLRRYDPAYLRHFPLALVHHDGELVAFANLWTGADRAELSVDLLRHLPDTPDGLLDYLFAESLAWGAAQGFRSFNIGLTPLAESEHHALPLLWHRIGPLIFRHGEHFSTGEKLRAYKQKFQPEWHPRYLVASPSIGLPRTLLNLAALIGGERQKPGC